MGFSNDSAGKESTCNAGDARYASSTPRLEGSPGGENANPLRCSCLGNPWTEEPGWLQSTGSERVGHNWAQHKYKLCVCSVSQSCPILCDPMDCSQPGSFIYGDSPGKNTGVGCHSLLQGTFLMQGSNWPTSPALQADSLPFEPPGKPDHMIIW